jgi:hypothetical protein
MSIAAAPVTLLLATFNNDRVGLCANVRELPEECQFELVVVDAISGEIVASRTYGDKEAAISTARFLTQ